MGSATEEGEDEVAVEHRGARPQQGATAVGVWVQEATTVVVVWEEDDLQAFFFFFFFTCFDFLIRRQVGSWGHINK
jgi:hypothetical protein